MADKRSRSTQDAILEAAVRVFSEAGFSGARVDEIARVAKANKAMIYYHFGSKKALYRAVVARLFGPVVAEVERLRRDPRDPKTRLFGFYAGVVGLFERNPALAHVMLREILAGGKQTSRETTAALASILGFVRATLESGAAQGSLRPADPLLTHLSLLGPIVIYFVSQPFRERLLPAALPGAADPGPEALIDHLRVLFDRGLAPLEPAPAAAGGGPSRSQRRQERT